MRKLLQIISYCLLMGLVFTGCKTQDSAGTNVSNSIDLDDFETYGIVNLDDNNNELTALNCALPQSIMSEMDGMGLQKDSTYPDLLVLYRFVDEPTTLVMENYVNLGDYLYEDLFIDFSDMNEIDNVRSVKVEPGTVVIQLMDREKNEILWTGWSKMKTSDTPSEEPIDNNVVTDAVEEILDGFSS